MREDLCEGGTHKVPNAKPQALGDNGNDIDKEDRCPKLSMGDLGINEAHFLLQGHLLRLR